MNHAINSGTFKITCPDAECGSRRRLKHKDVQSIVTLNMYRKYYQIQIKYTIALSENKAWCPSPNCNKICQISGSSVASKVTCPKCKKEFCSKCSQDWHPGSNCQETMNRIFALNENSSNLKPCPKCFRPIEKKGGCRYVICYICKLYFCWDCQKELKYRVSYSVCKKY